MTTWIILTTALLIKIVQCAAALALSITFLRGYFNRTQLRRWDGSNSSNSKEELIVVYLVVPLLREQAILPRIFHQFVVHSKRWNDVYVVFVSTEREKLERVPTSHDRTTVEVLQELLYASRRESDRVFHFHFPTYNRVVAEQLNYAFEKLAQLPGPPLRRRYIAVYNADSMIGEETIQELRELAQASVCIGQQSSLFLANVPWLLSNHHYYLTVHGLYQSCWTIQHEIPRYLVSKKFLPWLPQWMEENSLIHCVTHGLLLRFDTLQSVRGFPVLEIGGEDLALGFVLKAHGYKIIPLMTLENSETPDCVASLWQQLAGWYLATIGYLSYRRLLKAEVQQSRWATVFALTVLGVIDSLKWLFKGAIVLIYLALSWSVGHFLVGLILYLSYVYLSLAAMLWLWTCLPANIFPRPPLRGLLAAIGLFWIVPIVRSGPAFLGAWWAVRIILGMPFIKPKTERH